jgi:intracellular multiplication protein IcmX
MRTFRHVVPGLLLLASSQIHAGDDDTLDSYVKNFGAWLGYDVSQPVNSPLSELLAVSTATNLQQFSFITLLGAMPVNAYTADLSYFVPSSADGSYAALNSMANFTFAKQPNSGAYSSPSTGTDGGVSASSLIDQPSSSASTYQNDPVTQSILNTLTTRQTTFCLSKDLTTWESDCSYLYDSKIASNVMGAIPDKLDTYFTYDYNQNIIPQLNSNSLFGPLLYATTSTASTTSSSTETDTDDGLTAQNQLQEANNFILYAAGLVTPPTLPKLSEFDKTYQAATTDSTDATSVLNKQLSQEKIGSYFTKLRSYAAQLSVPTGNLYAILAKRMSQSSDGSKQTSQALSEFKMATRRLYDPSTSSNNSADNTDESNQWVTLINNASSATVQKEIAILLSEINYQLYVSNQLNERNNATLSLMLIKSITPPTFKDSDIDIAGPSATDS